MKLTDMEVNPFVDRDDNSYQILLTAERLLKDNRAKGFDQLGLERAIALIKNVITLEFL